MPGQIKPVPWPVAQHRIHPAFRSLRDELLGHWPMWEGKGTVVQDISGNGQHLTFPSASLDHPTWESDSQEGPILSFDGTNSYMTIDEAGGLNPLILTVPSQEFSVVIRHKRDDAGSDKALFAWSGVDDIVFYLNDTALGSGGYRVFWRDVANPLVNENGPDLSDEWHTFALVSQGLPSGVHNHEVFRDGVSIGTNANTRSPAGPFTDLFFGAFGASNQNGAGDLSDVRIYNRRLHISEVRLLSDYPYGDITPWWNLERLIVPAAGGATPKGPLGLPLHGALAGPI